MEIIAVLIAIYIGGPLSLILLAVAGYQVWKHPKGNRSDWLGVLVFVGVVLLAGAIWSALALANTNFGL